MTTRNLRATCANALHHVWIGHEGKMLNSATCRPSRIIAGWGMLVIGGRTAPLRIVGIQRLSTTRRSINVRATLAAQALPGAGFGRLSASSPFITDDTGNCNGVGFPYSQASAAGCRLRPYKAWSAFWMISLVETAPETPRGHLHEPAHASVTWSVTRFPKCNANGI